MTQPGKKIRVFMGILSTGDRIDIQTYLFRDLQERYGDKIEMVFPDGCVHRFGHDFARNEVTEDFLASDCDVLWFLDNDVCPPKFIFDLITNHYDKWQVAGAPYPLWMNVPGTAQMSIVFTAYQGVVHNADGKQDGIKMAVVPKTGTEWVDALATGCLFIKREVFAKLEKPYFEFKRDPETMRVIEGEDLGFALKVNKLGIKFFCDHGMVCKHYKRVCLLDMNNYATEMSNAKTLEYDRVIRDQVIEAVKAAEAQGYKRGKEEALQASLAPKKTSSGLILPAGY